MSIIKNVGQLASSPMAAMQDVKKSGWLTPLLCVAASVAYIHSIPWRTPAQELLILKAWSFMQIAAIVSIYLAGYPQGGRGTIAETAKVVGFLTLVDGLGLFAARYTGMLQFLPLILLLLPVFIYLAVKAIHEYENDGMAFRVTASAFFIFEILMVLSLRFLLPATYSSLTALLLPG